MFNSDINNIHTTTKTLLEQVNSFLSRDDVKEVLKTDAYNNIVAQYPILFDEKNIAQVILVSQKIDQDAYPGAEALSLFLEEQINVLKLEIHVKNVKHPKKNFRFNFKTCVSIYREDEDVFMKFSNLNGLTRYPDGSSYYSMNLSQPPLYFTQWWKEQLKQELETLVFQTLAEATDKESAVSQQLQLICAYRQARMVKSLDYHIFSIKRSLEQK